jgi:hypothetical protein
VVGLLDANEEPQSKRLRYAVTGVAFILLMSFGIWFFFLRFISERHTVGRFLNAVVAQNFQEAYQIWKPRGSYKYADFLADWGRQGYYGPVQSYRIGEAQRPKDASGIVVDVEISPFTPFPSDKDPNSARNREIKLWVERSDSSLGFPPGQ